ncbi:MAG: carbamoyl-phosphate synthase large subunit [Armatimonadetes bacterium]|nr:carbamoyl-phosphate synthase large subunit [Armatimonadota bacterium]
MEKILVIGSGPIVIGQAAEFDYAGTQACKSLREEGYKVVLINSNPATIMTDTETADAVYLEPLTPEFCERVIARERPDALLPTLGGQTGLNLATQLANRGVLEKYNVRLLGTPLSAIQKAEDREEFRQLMREIKEPVPESWIIQSTEDLQAILDQVPYPCIVRPAYTLGGTGGGIASSKEELWTIGNKGLALSMRSQIMVERSLLGWKEIEYEVMRDRMGNCITICNMENFDPMGVHTGDSIVVAPSQTLSDIEYHMLRTASLKIIRALGIEGGCNVQLAVNPESFDYYVIEVNPRVSRSSALASKATGYPIARVSAKIALGMTLDEIDNQVTKTTKACFEPALDYCVVKIPRWPFDKFASGDRTLFTQMKATGEVMAIDRSFEAAFLKAIRGLEVKQKDLRHAGFAAMNDAELKSAVRIPTDERLWAIAEALRRGWSVMDVNRLSRVDPWFLRKMVGLIELEGALIGLKDLLWDREQVWQTLERAYLAGYDSQTIQMLTGVDPEFAKDWSAVQPLVESAQPALAAATSLQAAENALAAHPEANRANQALWAKWDPLDLDVALGSTVLAFLTQYAHASYKMVDTCAGEFESATPYYYAVHGESDEIPT